MSDTYVQDPGRIRELAADIAACRLSPVALTERYLDRIEQVDGAVEAWRVVDGDRALAIAAERETEAKSGRIRGSLHGIPVAIKDIIDVEGLPTRCNSRSRERAAPATADAEIVLALRTAGAIPLGKVHTTEFAFFDPSPARNPHNLAHTPGGSSSGSAAAVAAGMAPIAIGTQTVASVNRPAAYCGIAAFKPSTRAISGFGIAPLAPGYDTAGTFGWSVDDAVTCFEAIAPRFLAPATAPIKPCLSIVLPEDVLTSDASADVSAAMARLADAFAGAGHKVERFPSPIPFVRLAEIQRTTMLYETGRALRHLLDVPKGMAGDKIVEAVREGQAMPTSRYLDERAEIEGYATRFFEAHAGVDVFLWPATPEPAPKGLAWTGERKYIAPWTALGGPVVTLPMGKAANGLPIAALLCGHPGADMAMCGMARRLAGVVGA
jgi:aspartyl-tRNA(Asn)/glutamyl-tRNA(Gln) amidotransferase subunit A